MTLIKDGLILVDKPSKMTSFGVVARVRTQLNKKFDQRIKVGHTGTLDPFATGLMILVIGKECKNAQYYSKLDKVYKTIFVLGKTTPTADVEGRVTRGALNRPSLQSIKYALLFLTGEIIQTPPMFSAIKIQGRRAYDLARQGLPVTIPKRQVNVYKIDFISYQYPLVELKIAVSSGTYIRSLAVDLGKILGTGAYCKELRRLEVGKFKLDQTALKIQ